MIAQVRRLWILRQRALMRPVLATLLALAVLVHAPRAITAAPPASVFPAAGR